MTPSCGSCSVQWLAVSWLLPPACATAIKTHLTWVGVWQPIRWSEGFGANTRIYIPSLGLADLSLYSPRHPSGGAGLLGAKGNSSHYRAMPTNASANLPAKSACRFVEATTKVLKTSTGTTYFIHQGTRHFYNTRLGAYEPVQAF